MKTIRNPIPQKLLDLFKRREYDMEEIQETHDRTYRVRSAYGPGDFTLLKNGRIEQAYAGFIGREDKVTYVKEYEEAENGEWKLVYEEMI
jgi:hypothetical protein